MGRICRGYCGISRHPTGGEVDLVKVKVVVLLVSCSPQSTDV